MLRPSSAKNGVPAMLSATDATKMVLQALPTKCRTGGRDGGNLGRSWEITPLLIGVTLSMAAMWQASTAWRSSVTPLF
jgi:hypothetical protein